MPFCEHTAIYLRTLKSRLYLIVTQKVKQGEKHDLHLGQISLM